MTKSMIRRSALPMALAALALLGLSATSRGGVVPYDSETLGLGALNAQDGWAAGAAITVSNGTGVNISKVISSNGAATGSRASNPAYEWLTYSNTDTAAEYYLDIRPNTSGGSDGILFRVGPPGVTSIGFGVWGSKFALSTAGLGYGDVFTTASFGPNPWQIGPATDWYRLQFVIDFTANSGAGAGTLNFINLTAGDTAYSVVPGLSNINLKLNTISAFNRDPANWTSMNLRFNMASANTAELDNLAPGWLPEPTGLTLLLAAMATLAGRRSSCLRRASRP